MMITPALAQATGTSPGGGDIFQMLLPLVLVFGIFYLLVFRPQQKKMKELQEMINSVKRGDTIVTTGGIVGKVIRVGADGEVRVEVAEGVQIRLLKGAIAEVRGKTDPVREKVREAANEDEPSAKPGA